MGLEDRDYYRDEYRTRADPDINRYRRPRGDSNIPWGFICAVILLIIALLMYKNDLITGPIPGKSAKPKSLSHQGSPARVPPLLPKTQVFLQEQAHPENGAARIYHPRSHYVAPLNLEADPSNHYLVKLVDSLNNPVLYVFVAADRSVSIKAPLGTYDLMWVSGKRWYGYKDLFGNDAAYRKSQHPLIFEQVITERGASFLGHTVSFTDSVQGNLPSERISPSLF